MGYRVMYDQDMHLVRAAFEGEMSASTTGAMALEGLKICKERGCDKYIVDIRAAVVKDSTTETFMFMEGLAELGFTRGDRIAMVYSSDEEKHRFAELVAHNRGWVNIRYFDDLKEAEEWIRDL